MKENEPRMRSSKYQGGAHDCKQPDLKYLSAFGLLKNAGNVIKILVIIGL
jgi:hypothetical protein